MNAARLTVISLGAGVQSTTMALMAAHGEIEPMPDCAIFADTGWEPKAVYRHLEWLETALPFPGASGVGRQSARGDADGRVAPGERFLTVPFFTDQGGMGRRQCTTHYKIKPIRRKVRELLGRPKGPVPAGAVRNGLAFRWTRPSG